MFESIFAFFSLVVLTDSFTFRPTMPETPTNPSFDFVCNMSQTQFSKLSKQQLSSALRDAVESAAKHSARVSVGDSASVGFSPQLLKATVAEAVAEIRTELQLEAKRMVADLEDKFMRQLEDVNQSLIHFRMNLTSVIMDEIENRESRRNNVVIFGLHEEEDATEDHNQITELLSTLDVDENATVTKRSFRMGKKGLRPRPVKVIFDSPDKCNLVLRAASRLSKLSPDNNFRKVYIKPDLTPEQLMREKKLREELKSRRAAGENVVMRRGKIVRASFPIRRLFQN